MLRASLKSGLGIAFAATAADRAIGAMTGVRRLPLIAGYHRVVDTLTAEPATATPAMTISVQTLVQQLEWIGRRYRFVTLDDIGARCLSGEPWTEPVAAVTFDDGYRDVYHCALPVLTSRGIPATMFVITDAIGTSDWLTHDRLHLLLARDWPAARRALARLGALPAHRSEIRGPFETMRYFLAKRSQRELAHLIQMLEQLLGPAGPAPESLLPLTWDMVRAMNLAGITIGSHTRTHPVLTNEHHAHVVEELATSRAAIEREVGKAVRHFAYPDGGFNAPVVSAVAGPGYSFAYTTCRHRDLEHPELTIPRRFLWENSCLDAHGRFSPPVMSCLTNGVYDLVVSCQRPHRAAAVEDVEHAEPAAPAIG